MNRRVSIAVFVWAIAAIVTTATLGAHAQSLQTRHMHEEVLNGHAQPIGRLPATQTMQLDLVLPLRDPAGLDSFLSELYDPDSPFHGARLSFQMIEPTL